MLREYGQRRNAALGNPLAEFELAQWCRTQDLTERERLHLMRVVAHPNAKPAHRKTAAKRLRLRQHAGMLLTEQQYEQIAERTKEVTEALEEWSVQALRWRKAIASGKRKKNEAMKALAELDDPRSIAALELELSPLSEELALAVVGVLDRIEHPSATMSLVRHALGSPWPSVMDAAMDALEQRPRHEYVPALLANLDTPMYTAFKVIATEKPDGTAIVRREQIFVKEGLERTQALVVHSMATPMVNYQQRSNNYSSWRISNDPTEWKNTRATTDPEVTMDDRTARSLEQKARAVGEAKRTRTRIAMQNERIAESNQRIFRILEHATGELIARSPTAWWDWWYDYNEVTTTADCYYGEPQYGGKPTEFLNAFVYSRYSATVRTETTTTGERVGPPTSCFRAQTPVWTETGLVPIESVTVGDRVLSKDTENGQLELHLVLGHTLRPPAEIIEIEFDQSTIQCTKGHPFWVSGAGWRMAKLLKPGDRIHALDGTLEVCSVNANFMHDETHNLIVDKAATYFVGKQGLLVHDNTYRRPTRAVIPGFLPAKERVEPESVAGESGTNR